MLENLSNTEIGVGAGAGLLVFDRLKAYTIEIIKLIQTKQNTKPVQKANGKDVSEFFKGLTDTLTGVSNSLIQHRTYSEDKLKSAHGHQGEMKAELAGIKAELITENRLFDDFKDIYRDDFREMINKLNSIKTEVEK